MVVGGKRVVIDLIVGNIGRHSDTGRWLVCGGTGDAGPVPRHSVLSGNRGQSGTARSGTVNAVQELVDEEAAEALPVVIKESAQVVAEYSTIKE